MYSSKLCQKSSEKEKSPQLDETKPWVKAAKEFRKHLLALPLQNGDPQVVRNYSPEAKLRHGGENGCKVIDFIGMRKLRVNKTHNVKEEGKPEFVTRTEIHDMCYLADEVRKAVCEIAKRNNVNFEFCVDFDRGYLKGPYIPPGCEFHTSKVSLVFRQ